MKRGVYAALSAVLALLLAPACAQQTGPVETAYVYKPDGTQHCDMTKGASLDSMARELLDRDIAVYARRKSHDGREGMALCGNPTGGINVYEIAKADLSEALKLGFLRLSPSWFDPR